MAKWHVLVEKMCVRIEVWRSMDLSYTKILQLVNSILLSIHIYWAQVYIIPQTVLGEIEQVCRAFL